MIEKTRPAPDDDFTLSRFYSQGWAAVGALSGAELDGDPAVLGAARNAGRTVLERQRWMLGFTQAFARAASRTRRPTLSMRGTFPGAAARAAKEER